MSTISAGAPVAAAPDAAGEHRLGHLRTWNVAVGVILAVQAVLIAVLTNNFSLPVTATFISGPPGTAARLHHLFDVPIGWGVFAFLAISAAALLVIASPPVFGWYTRNLLQSRNYGRWIEYFFSSSLMIVLIAMITGVSDIAALLAIFGVNAAMILFGALQERYEQPGRPSWLPFWFGSFAGIIPWVVGGDLRLGARPEGVAARFRVRHHRHAVRLLQLLRRQHGVAVQAGRAVARLPVRREGVHHPQPDR